MPDRLQMKIFLPLIAVVCSATCVALAPIESPEWLAAKIGSPAVAGKHDFADGVLNITAAGKGEGGEADQLHFMYREFPAGDVELVARLTSLSGAPQARSGLMLRPSNDPAATIALVAYLVGDASGNRHAFQSRGRNLAAAAGRQASGGHTGGDTPPVESRFSGSGQP